MDRPPPDGGGTSPGRPPLQALNGHVPDSRPGGQQACSPAAHPHTLTPPPLRPPPPGAASLLAVLRSRVAAAEASLAARQAGLERKKAMLADAEALVGELCARTTTGVQGGGGGAGGPPALTPTTGPVASRLLRSGDWVVSVRVGGGDAETLSRARLVLVPAGDGGGEGAWRAAARPAQVSAAPPGQPATATLAAVVPRAHTLVDRTPSVRGPGGPALAADVVVVVAPGVGAAGATPTIHHAGRAALGWDAILAREAGVLLVEEEGDAEAAPASSDDEEGGGVGDDASAAARTTLRLAAPSTPPALAAALARVLGPSLSAPTAGTACLVAPDLVELAAPGRRRLTRLAAGVAAALAAAGLALAQLPALPTHTPASARRRAARLSTAARAMVEEVDAVHAALVASLRLAEGRGGSGGGGGQQPDPGALWAAANAAGEKTDAAVAACW